MAADGLQDDSDYLLSLVERLRDLHGEMTRLNRRLRNVRQAIRSTEADLAILCDEIGARLEQVRGSQSESSSSS